MKSASSPSTPTRKKTISKPSKRSGPSTPHASPYPNSIHGSIRKANSDFVSSDHSFKLPEDISRTRALKRDRKSGKLSLHSMSVSRSEEHTSELQSPMYLA